jgi:hypothetical protein
MHLRLWWLVLWFATLTPHGKRLFGGQSPSWSATAASQIMELNRYSNTTYEERILAHNQLILNRSIADRDAYSQVIMAYAGRIPLDEAPLTGLLNRVGVNSSNSDFSILVLTRILFFTSRTNMSSYYDQLILPKLQSERFWYTTERGVTNDDTMNSENHMILWMSSAWLLQEQYQWNYRYTYDPTLRQRLTHFLRLKIEYGFYEFLSITYLPLTFAALVNLADFARDIEIKALAESALRRLVGDYLMFVTTLGLHATAAGRDYAERFVDGPYSQPMDGIVYLLTGFGVWDRTKTDYINF